MSEKLNQRLLELENEKLRKKLAELNDIIGFLRSHISALESEKANLSALLSDRKTPSIEPPKEPDQENKTH